MTAYWGGRSEADRHIDPCAAEGYDLNLPDDSPWYCTLPEGHNGDHEAWGLREMFYRWPQEDPSVLVAEIEAWLRWEAGEAG